MSLRDRKTGRFARNRPAIDRAAGQWTAPLRTAPEDATTVTWQADGNWQGVSEPGQPEALAALAPEVTGAADTTPLDAIRAAGYRAWDIRHGQQPAASPPPETERAPVADETAAGWKRLFEIRCAYPAAQHDTPIPCAGVHRDPAAGTFPALRRSAHAAGWHEDADLRWACPRCQMSPRYRTLYPVTIWAPEWAARWTQTAGGQWHYNDFPDDAPGLDALTVRAELRLIENVTGSAQRGKHRRVSAA